MSTPTGKPFSPVRISDYAPKRVRDRDRLGVGSGPASVERPEWPSETRSEPEDAQLGAPQPVDEPEEPQTPLAPVGPHERNAQPRHHGEDGSDRADDAPEYEAANDDGEDDAYSETDEYESEYSEPRSDRALAERAQADRVQADRVQADRVQADRVQADRAQAERTQASRRAYEEHRDAYAVDLQQLEEDLTSFRSYSGESSRRLPPAGQLPPARGLRSPDETYIDGFRLPRSLDPSFMPPPPMQERTNHWGMIKRITIAIAVAAPIAYFLVYYFSAVTEPSSRGPKLASADSQAAALPPMPPMSQEAAPLPPQPAPAVAPPQQTAVLAPPQPPRVPQPQAAAPQPTVVLSAPQAVAPPAPSASPPPLAWPERRETIGVAMAPPTASLSNPPVQRPMVPHPANAVVREMKADEIAMLMNQAEQFISAGDVVTARVLFQRAAEAGDAKAALALGASFDPALLAKMGVRGISPDVQQARNWYEKARDLGSSEALARLEKLSAR